MTVIYEPKGKAREYAPLALNLYRGCSHGCVYCYAPDICRVPRNLFFALGWPHPLCPQGGTLSAAPLLKKIKKDAAKLANDPREILLSFTSDAYQPAEKEYQLTRQALEILMTHGLTVTILTKGGAWGLGRDSDLLLLNPANSWAVTLTLDDPAASRAWEPCAALPQDRINSLMLAKAAGLHTWVSFEPVISPPAVYRLLEATAPFTDHYKVGTLNYHPHAQTINWRAFKEEIESRLQALGKDYYLKQDLIRAAVLLPES